MVEKKEKEVKTVGKNQDKVTIMMFMDDIRALWLALTGTQGQQRVPGELERFGGKPGFFLSLTEGAIRTAANAIGKKLSPDMKWQTKYFVKVQKLQDQFAMRNKDGQAIPGSLDPTRVDKYYELLEALEEQCKDLIEKEYQRQEDVMADLREKQIEIEISHKLLIDEPEYREFLYDLSKQEIKLLSPFFDGEYSDLDFADLEKKHGREVVLKKEIEELKLDIKAKDDQIEQLKKPKDEPKKP
jgi:hypothetical protein